jgi:hypothetical protein
VSEFKVGEVVVFCPCGQHKDMTPQESARAARLAGSDMTITKPLGRHLAPRTDLLVYVVVTPCGLSGGVPPCCLRRKRRPDEAGSWDRIEELTGWQPAGVTA